MALFTAMSRALTVSSPARLLRRLVAVWRRSLQLRVAASTAVASGLVVVVIGVVLLNQISAGVLDAKRTAALADADKGLNSTTDELSAITNASPDQVKSVLFKHISSLSGGGRNAGNFDVVIVPMGSDNVITEPIASSGDATLSQVPVELRQEVQESRQSYQYARIGPAGDTVRGLVVGEPVRSKVGEFGLYYLFSLESEQQTLDLVRSTVIFAGLVLVLLVAAIAVIVTRQVVAPVRQAVETAERLAAGRLEERMPVKGVDDLARLATSFNAMAASLQRQITQLEELSRVQRRFTSDVSHELRTPLTTVRMAADLLYDARDQFEPGMARSAELLHAELERFETLLTDLLEISRHDAGVVVLDAEPIDLRSVVRSSVDSVAVIAARVSSDLVVRVPPGSVVAEVDPRRIERILRNLLSNALEYGAGMPVEVRLVVSDHAASMTVRDRGAGLTEEEAARVFDRFWRADPARTRHSGGTGLGLAISLEDARLHNGGLDAWGRPGEGSQFRLTVPLRAGDDVGIPPAPVEPLDVPPPAHPEPAEPAEPAHQPKPPVAGPGDAMAGSTLQRGERE